MDETQETTSNDKTPIPPDLGSNPEPEKPEEKGNGQANTENLYREIARQEAQILSMKRDFESMKSENEQLKGLEGRLRKEGPGLLEEFGWDLNTISSRVLNDNVPTVEEEIKKVRDEIKTLQDEKQKADFERQKADRERFLSDYTNELREAINSNEAYAPLKTLLDIMQVVLGKEPDLGLELAPVLDKQYSETGTIHQPAKMADLMLENAKNRVDQIKAHEALKRMFGIADERQGESEQPEETTTVRVAAGMVPMTTLSNSVDSNNAQPVDSNKLTHDDRMRLLTQRLEELSQQKP